MRVRKKQEQPPLTLQLTSMIDVVFLLLVFFVMTFKIVLPEGDFVMRQETAGPGPTSDAIVPEKFQVQLLADANGRLTEIRAGDRRLANVADLRGMALHLCHRSTGMLPREERPEVTFVADPNLHYNYLVDAMTAVKGYPDANGSPIPLLDRITLSRTMLH